MSDCHNKSPSLTVKLEFLRISKTLHQSSPHLQCASEQGGVAQHDMDGVPNVSIPEMGLTICIVGPEDEIVSQCSTESRSSHPLRMRGRALNLLTTITAQLRQQSRGRASEPSDCHENHVVSEHIVCTTSSSGLGEHRVDPCGRGHDHRHKDTRCEDRGLHQPHQEDLQECNQQHAIRHQHLADIPGQDSTANNSTNANAAEDSDLAHDKEILSAEYCPWLGLLQTPRRDDTTPDAVGTVRNDGADRELDFEGRGEGVTRTYHQQNSGHLHGLEQPEPTGIWHYRRKPDRKRCQCASLEDPDHTECNAGQPRAPTETLSHQHDPSALQHQTLGHAQIRGRQNGHSDRNSCLRSKAGGGRRLRHHLVQSVLSPWAGPPCQLLHLRPRLGEHGQQAD
mmetsp:Transcript_1086/g.2434  ORF Transcript_1086/g.2434 Transcript_1086/m.2434 type:complete len:395 (+) Transcript_1086:286-1470(+)